MNLGNLLYTGFVSFKPIKRGGDGFIVFNFASRLRTQNTKSALPSNVSEFIPARRTLSSAEERRKKKRVL